MKTNKKLCVSNEHSRGCLTFMNDLPSWKQYHPRPVVDRRQCQCTLHQRPKYRVGSANFSQWKIGHAHDNSADSENIAGAPQRSVHAHLIFRFENGPGNQSHSDSLDTLLYARFDHSEPRVLCMETKKSWMGTFPRSHNHDSCTMAFSNPLLYV